MNPKGADGMTNSVDPYQTAPTGSGSTLFAQGYLFAEVRINTGRSNRKQDRKRLCNKSVKCAELFSLPEPKAHRWAYSVGSHLSSLRPSLRQHFQTTSFLKPCSRFLPNFTYSIYRPGEGIWSVLFQSDKKPGDLQKPLTYNGTSGNRH